MKKPLSLSDIESMVIGDKFEFLPLLRELRVLETQENAILHSTASQCLLLLLCHQGQILTREELIEFAWGEKAANFVTNHTFYQTISVLRKALVALGCDDIIITVPRKGLTVGAGIKISTIYSVAASKKIYNTGSTSHTWYSFLSAKFLFAIAGIMLCTGMVLVVTKTNTDPFSFYQDYSLGKCIIKFSDSRKVTFDSSIVNRLGINCEDGNKTVFITVNEDIRLDSAIVCDTFNRDKQDCHTIRMIR